MSGIKIKGLDKLEKALKPNATLADVRKVVHSNGVQLQKRMQQKADFAKGYQTGTTKRSILLEMQDDGFSAAVGPETEYHPYLEYGTRFMEAQPFIKPALDEQKKQFFSDLEKLMR